MSFREHGTKRGSKGANLEQQTNPTEGTDNARTAVDRVVSDLILYLENTYTAPRMIGLAMRLRSRLAEFRKTSRWLTLNGRDPQGHNWPAGEPARPQSANRIR